MKATERARRFAAGDQVERSIPRLLFVELNVWAAGLGVAAAALVTLAVTSGSTSQWLLGGACGIAGLLCWMLARAG